MNLVFVTFKFSHHGTHSGYDKLIDYFPDAKVINGQFYEKILGIIQKQPNFIRKSLMRLIGNKRHWIEFWAILKTKNEKDTVVHFLYPENQYRYFGRMKGNRKVIATFHQPPEFYNNLSAKRRKNYQLIDKAIVVSRNMINTIEKYVGAGKVVFIPHGVDTNFFKPVKNSTNGNKKKVLTVGNWKRDFDLLVKVASKMMEIDSSVTFEIISIEDNKKIFKGLRNVKFRCNISDEDLLEAYHKSCLLFLPLLDCTANNALLEGLACGLPILVTDVGGVRDYADDSSVSYCNNNMPVDTICKLILKGCGKYRNVNISYIDKFNWNNISKTIIKQYESLKIK